MIILITINFSSHPNFEDRVNFAGWDVQATEKAEGLINDFQTFIEANKDEITALKIFYSLPSRYQIVTFRMIEELMEAIKANKPPLLPLRIWQAYEQIEQVKGQKPLNELTALVSLVRRVIGLDSTLTNYESVVNKNFQEWVFKKQAGALKFTEEQMIWLRMIKDHISSSFHLDREDLDYAPFDSKGGVGKMYQLFGNEMDTIIDEINLALVA